jgi:hypothetical protein
MAANSKKLGDLHEAVAEALAEQVKGYEEPVLNAEGEAVGTKIVRPGPALLGAAISFLKNNNITADPEENEKLRDLSKALQARREKRLPASGLEEAAQLYAESVGRGSLMQ